MFKSFNIDEDIDGFKRIKANIYIYNKMVNSYIQNGDVTDDVKEEFKLRYKQLVFEIELMDFSAYDLYIDDYKGKLIATIDNTFAEPQFTR